MRIFVNLMLFIALLTGALVIAYNAGIMSFIDVAYLKEHRVALRYYVDAHYLHSVLWYICVYFLVAALALPAASLFILIGGFLFGTVAGAFYANIGATLGATAVFLLVRYYLGAPIQGRYHHQLKLFNAEFAANGIYYLLSVRLVSVIPFFIINICAGLTQATVVQFMVTTAVGILPGALVYSYAGQQLMHINTLQDMVTLPVILSFAALALLSLVPIALKKRV